ncbi:MAG: cytidylate kinase family protein [Dictyoglomus sp.]|nr:cytidylate kinase family protein [Dictyoglomus sp.]MCX7942858.1 cytidylate kinase family protein [Dictyoglomaceae bacterium]MDW8189086.1 cytidylate kinase family protein [Dictyoglomus sp.]
MVRLITVAREFGTEIDFLFTKLSKEFGFILLDRVNLFPLLQKYCRINSEELLLEEKKIEKNSGEKEFIEKYKEGIKEITKNYLEKSPVILLGRGGQFLFKDYPNSFHINIIAPLNLRVKNLQKNYNLDRETSIKLILEKDKERDIYFKTLFGYDWKDPYHYHLIINLDYYSPDEIYQIIIKSIEKPTKINQPLQESFNFPSKIKFANKSEEEFAKLLTFYRIAWEYEPRVFPLEWDAEGQVIEAFTPDFYLPEFDLYIELTVQKPKLMSEKIKKIKKLKELYPNINIKLLYGRDYIKILEKYGISKVK